MNGQPNQRKPRRLRFASQQNPLSRIPQWSIEHPYAVIAFYVAVLALAFIAIGRMPRRFAPYVQSPLIGVVTMMHY
jgi:HAE1 family hydrophobic/amphiphilic exporter-1